MKIAGLLLPVLLVSAVPEIAVAQLAYGPDTCRQGYVWREAYRGDHVCVTPQMRDQAASDNRRANARREPNGGAYGRDTCRQGYVWREARSGDHVCVTPEVRSQTASDNRHAAARRARPPKGGTIDDGPALNPVRE